MFFHFDKNFKLLVPGRTGSTSMHEYLGYKERALTGNSLPWREFNKGKKLHIVVIRHPIERYWSASKQNSHEYGSRVWYEHCQPFLHNITCNFKFIRFEKLENYIPIAHQPTEFTFTSERHLLDFRRNDYLTKDDLTKEVALYEKMLRSKTELAPSDWKELTKYYN